MSEQPRRVAIIGAGFGGLAAAIRLQAAGLETVLFERLDQAGGRAYVYRQDGFVFDGGPTVITAPECIEELFELAGERLADHVELMPVEPFYRLLWPDGDAFDYSGDPERLHEQIRAKGEGELEGYQRFVAYSKAVYDEGYTKLAAQPFLRFWDMVKVAPQLARLRADRSVYATVARYVKDEHLRQALSFHSLLVGGDPFQTSSIYTLIHYLERHGGVFFPRGGTGALVQALVDLYGRLGGELRLECPVEGIRLEGTTHRVTSPARPDEPFDAVVSNADLHHTYAQLLGDEPRARPTARRLQRMAWSMSLFVLYFGTRKTYPDVAHHTIVFGERYRELIREIFAGPDLPEDFSLYLHAPTRSDPSMAPDGCEAFYVLAPVPHLGKADVDWPEVATAYGDRILKSLEQRLLPGLREHLVTRHHLTPEGFQRIYKTYHGSAFSVAPLLTQSAWLRPHNRDPRVPGLYIVGAGTHPGAGVPGVINSGKATAALVVNDLRRGE